MLNFRIPTDSGFCCALNTKQLLLDSKYRDLVPERNQFEKRAIKTSDGINNGLRIILDLHSNQVSFGTLETEFSAFSMFIGRPDDFPMMKRKSLKIQPGQEHFIEISGTRVIANDIRAGMIQFVCFLLRKSCPRRPQDLQDVPNTPQAAPQAYLKTCPNRLKMC